MWHTPSSILSRHGLTLLVLLLLTALLRTPAASSEPAQAGASAPTEPPLGGNRLLNPGFEEGTAGAGLPTPWAAVYGDAQTRWSVDESRPHSGRRSARMELPTVPAKDSAASVEQTLAVTPGTAFYCAAWTRGEPVGAEGMIFIVWKTRDGGWISVSGSRFTYTADWQQVVVIGSAPAGAFTGTARVDIRSAGVAWVDDVEMGRLVPDSLVLDLGDGVVRAGAELPFSAAVFDRWHNPVPAAEIELRLEGRGSARLRCAGGVAAGPGKAFRVLTDERGLVHGTLTCSREAGQRDVLRGTAPGLAPEKSASAALTTAAAGRPSAYRVAVDDEFPRVGAAPLAVRVQLVGAYGEPLPAAGRRGLQWQLEGDGRLAEAATVLRRDGTATNLLTPGAALAKVKVMVSDEAGIRGVSATITRVPAPRPDAVRLAPNGYFVHADGRPFVPLGGMYANFVHAVEGGHIGAQISASFSEVTDEQLRAWFAYLADNGCTALRGMLRDHTRKGCEPLDLIGQTNLDLLGRWRHMLELAQPYDIRFLLTLHESWYATYASYHNVECLEKTVLPYYAGQDLASLPAYRRRFLVDKRMVKQTTDMLSDPEVMACQRDYLRDALPRLVAIPGIFAYEIENEQCNGFLDWTATQLQTVRQVDRFTPVCVSPLGILAADSASWTRTLDLDFFSPHAYSSSRDAELAMEVLVGAKYTRMFIPSFTGEAEGYSDGYKYAPVLNQVLGVRDTIWFQLVSGCPGCFIWYSDTDAVYAEFRLPKAIMGRLDLAHLRWARAPLGIDVSHETKADSFFATEEGRGMLATMTAYAEWCLAQGLAFDFTFDTAPYAVRRSGRAFVEPPRLRGPLGVPPKGLQVQYLVSEDDACVFAYVRNQAGLQDVSGLGYDKTSTARLRTRAPVSARLDLNLPFRTGKATVWDLDTRAETTSPVSRNGVLSLAGAPSDHDFVLIIQRN